MACQFSTLWVCDAFWYPNSSDSYCIHILQIHYKFISERMWTMFNICYVSPSSSHPILLLFAPLSASLYAHKFETREKCTYSEICIQSLKVETCSHDDMRWGCESPWNEKWFLLVLLESAFHCAGGQEERDEVERERYECDQHVEMKWDIWTVHELDRVKRTVCGWKLIRSKCKHKTHLEACFRQYLIAAKVHQAMDHHLLYTGI